jgi:ankyrin repeat protein
MKQLKRFCAAILICLSLLVLSAFPVWLSITTSQQEQLNTDLIVALRTGQVEEVKSLLEQGADPNARDLPNVKPPGLLQQIIDLFTHPRHPEVEQARTALSCATDSKHAAVLVKLLLDKGASLKADEKCERPALCWAARGGDIATVRLLLDRGADVNVRDQVGFTPLQGAVLSDKPELVQLLLDHGAQVQGGNNIMGTPFTMARSAEIVNMLKKSQQK